MSKVSVIIPSRNEIFLPQTVADILKHATGSIEVIAVLDGAWANPMPADDPRLTILHYSNSHGMRNAINSAAAIAKGDYLMKCDGHCSFQEGFDEVLKADCDDNWVVIPRRDRLDAENWTKQETGKPPIDYHYLSCPITNKDGYSMHGGVDNKRATERVQYDVDEAMSFQGSCWFMSRKHWERLGGMPEEFYGGFTQEPTQIGMKTWLGGGKVMTNKKTTYLHLHKGKKYGRGYFQDKHEIIAGHFASAIYWMSDGWKDAIYNMEWFIDRFWPVPTWPENWQEIRFQDVNGNDVNPSIPA